MISDFKLLFLMLLSLRWIETTKTAFTIPAFEDRNKLEMEKMDLTLKFSNFSYFCNGL